MPLMKLRILAAAFLLVFCFQFGKAQNVGIGTTNPLDRLHVAGAVRVNSLTGTGNRVVGSNANGTLINIAAGTNGQVLTQTAAGPAFQSAGLNINSTSLGADIQISSAAYANVPGMTVTFTATDTDAMLMFSASGFAFTNSMAYVQFRIRNGATTLGGTNTKMQSYDDVTGTITSWSCAFTRRITGLVVGNTYTYTLQGQVAGILGTPNAAIFASSQSDAHHMTLSVLQ